MCIRDRNTIYEQTAQINTKIVKYGEKNIEEIFGKEKKEEEK